jgi:putative ABC transport system permease protein
VGGEPLIEWRRPRWQIVGALIGEACLRVRSEWRRDLVAVVGLVWGAAGVVFLLSVGAGLLAFLDAGFAKTGDRWSVVAGRYTAGRADSVRPGHRVVLDRLDLERVAGATPSARWVGGEVLNQWATVRSARHTRSNVVVGASPSIPRIKAMRVAHGRFFDETDEREGRRVAVLGAALVPVFFGSADPLGRFLRIEGDSYRVVGVLEKVGQQLVVTYGLHDEVVWIPLSAGQRTLGRGDELDLVYASSRRADEHDALEAELRAALARTHQLQPGDRSALFVLSIAEIAAPLRRVGRLLHALLGLVGAITLSIAAVGVANVMAARVNERRVELAVRRACGARRSDVLLQLWVETGLLVSAGAILGSLVAVGSVAGIARLPLPDLVPVPVLSWGVVATSVLVLGATALVTALGPARLAAEADPAAAMRAS